MFEAHSTSTDPLPLPPRCDAILAAGAAVGFGGEVVFFASQADAGLAVHGDVRFGIVIWCLAVSAPSAICWMLRPQITHMAYAMRLGLALSELPEPPALCSPRWSFTARRWVWGTCGTLGVCAWLLAAALDTGAATGRLLLHGHPLDYATLALCHFGAVCITVRIMGPSLAAVDQIYGIARGRDDEGGGTVLDFRPRGSA